MIIDRLANAAAWAHAARRLQSGLEFLRHADLASLSEGRHEIDGEHLFALVLQYTTRPAGECAWEAHRKYFDLQYVVDGVERMGYMNLSHARERTAYDAERDVAFYEAGDDYVTVRAGMVAVFGPEDVHSPSVAAGAPAAVRKIVVKAAVGEP